MLVHVQQRLPRLLDRPILFAHRGGCAHAPENSLEAFQLALRLGANGLETDVWVTKDGVAVIDHDGYRGRAFGRRWIRDYDYTALPYAVPTLAHLLDTLAHQSFSLSIDVKDSEAFRPILDVIRPRSLGSRVYCCHPDLATLEIWAPNAYDINLVHSTALKSLKAGPEQHAAELSKLGIRACNMHQTDWNGGLTSLYHRFQLLTFAWDVQHQSLAANLLRMGIDAIFGDDVTIMHEAERNDEQ
jgi:glycerophosphoryl diester phosphodiesterase